MPTTYYHTCNGRLIGETTGTTRTDYLTDALGSVTATVDQTQTIINTYRYKPYGSLLAKTGSGADPRFLWTGNTSSRTTYSYDKENRLSTLRIPGGSAVTTYTYDGDGLRRTTKQNTASTTYIWDGTDYLGEVN